MAGPPTETAARLTAGVVQVLDASGAAAGAGFVAAGDVVLTCAHVVTAAGGGPGGRVRVRFPQLDGSPEAEAEVPAAGWRAPSVQDVAVLRVGALPAGAAVLPMGSAAGARGHAVCSFGFPAQAVSGGHHGYGKAGGLLRPGADAGLLLQLGDANDLTVGFSGGPVLDERTGLVLGMVTAITRVDAHLRGGGIAYATAAETLREVWPELRERDVCPYRGLEVFTTEHAAWFHGRAEAVERVLAALAASPRAVLLLGPSGAGKSSLMGAGVLPALSGGALPGSDTWAVMSVRPASLVPESVREQLAGQPAGHRLLLFVDQFEELLVPPAARPEVLGRLTEMIGTPGLSVVLVMRDDFYPRLAALAPGLLDAVPGGTVNIPAGLSPRDLRDIIGRPAEAVGVRPQDGLTERIIGDVLAAGPDPPGARQAPTTVLPLLEVTLQQLWRRRDDGRLTHEAYERLGGVAGGLTTWCDAVVDGLDDSRRLVAQRVLTALVRPADPAHGVPAVRRQVALATLRDLADAAEPAFDEVVAALTASRIITTSMTTGSGGAPGEPVAELLHDALIRDWATLRSWAEQDSRFSDWLRRAEERRARSTGRPDDLLAGSDLLEGLDWARRRRLPRDTAAFLDASHRRQRTRTRRARQAVLALVLAVVASLGGAGIALRQRQNAVAAERAAVAAEQTALSRQLAAQSTTVRSTDPDLASLLAVAAFRTRPTAEATAGVYAAAALPLEHRLAGTAAVEQVVFAAKGGGLATIADDGSARLWDTGSGRLRAALAGPVSEVAFSPDGKTVAAAGRDGVVRLGEPPTVTLTGHRGAVNEVAFSPDGKTVASGGSDGEVRLWDVAGGRLRARLPGHDGEVTDLEFTRDGRTLVTGSFDPLGEDSGDDVRLWDVATGRAGAVVGGGDTPLDIMTVSRDGRTLAAGSADGTVHLWALPGGRPRATFTGHTGSVTELAFSPDGRTLASGSFDEEGADGTVRLWDAAKGRRGPALTGTHNAMAFAPDGRTLATAGEAGVRLWDSRTGKARAALADAGGMDMVAYSPDGRTLATGSLTGDVVLWDPAAGQARASFSGRTPWLTTMLFSPDGLLLATAGADGTTRLWNATAGLPRGTLRGHRDRVGDLVFSADGRTVITASLDGTARTYDPRTGRLRATIGRPGTAMAATVSPDGRTLAVASSDDEFGSSAIGLWDVAGRRLRATLGVHTGTGYTVVFSPDSRSLVTWSIEGEDGDGLVRLWDATGARLRATLLDETESGSATAVVFSPDGRTLVTGSVDDDDKGSVRLWNAGTGQPRGELAGSLGYVTALAFSGDGRTLASGDGDGTVRLWDPAGKRLIATLAGHTDAVRHLAFSADGSILASGGGDGTVRMWGAPGGEPLATLAGPASLAGSAP
ncbi:nSTAND1 domain-containing NTPase, partial [Paractinoplanes deccanensis]